MYLRSPQEQRGTAWVEREVPRILRSCMAEKNVHLNMSCWPTEGMMELNLGYAQWRSRKRMSPTEIK